MILFKDTIVGTQRGPVKVSDLKTDDSLIGCDYNLNKIKSIDCISELRHMIRFKGMCIPNMICSKDTMLYASEKMMIYENRRYHREFKEASWVKADEIEAKKYFLSVPINDKQNIPSWNGTIMNFGGHTTFNRNDVSDKISLESFWYLIGRYLGDGWTRKNYQNGKAYPGGITICCTDKDEKSLVDSVIASGFNYTKTTERTTYRISIYSKDLYNFVERYSHGAYNKTIDVETMNLPNYLLSSFIKGYTDSDGTFTENNFKITTISPYLSYSISQCILKTYNTNYRIYYFEMPKTKQLEGRTINQQNQYQIVWNQNILETKKKAFIKDNMLWFPIKEVEEIELKDDFYNIIFEDENIGFNQFYVLCR